MMVYSITRILLEIIVLAFIKLTFNHDNCAYYFNLNYHLYVQIENQKLTVVFPL